MPFEVFGDVEGIEELAVEAGKHHLHDDYNVQLLGVREVFVRILLVLDALLHIAVVFVEEIDCEVGAELGVIIVDDLTQLAFVAFRILIVVCFLLGQVFVGAVPHRRREHSRDIQGHIIGDVFDKCILQLLEYFIEDDCFRDRRCGEESVETTVCREGVVVVQNVLDDLPDVKGHPCCRSAPP